MSAMNMIEALNSAHDVMMERDDNVVVMGEDVGFFGGVFRVTAGLQKKYGRSRVFDAPISEGGIMGVAIGMATYGLRPVAEIDAFVGLMIDVAQGAERRVAFDPRPAFAESAVRLRAVGQPA